MGLTLVFPDHTVVVQEILYSLALLILLPRVRPMAAAVLAGLALALTAVVVFYSNPSVEQTFVRIQLGYIFVLFLARRLFPKEGDSQSDDGTLGRYLVSVRFISMMAVIVYVVSMAFKSQDVLRVVASIWFLFAVIWGLYRRPSVLRIPWKAVAVNGSVLFVSVGVSLGVIELGLRAFVDVQRPPGFFAPHGKYIFTLARDGSGTLLAPTESPSFTSFGIKISSQGLRDRDYGPKSADEFRILLIGDSFAFGHGLEMEDTIGRRLEVLMAEERPGSKISVMNGGVGGYAPWQSRGLLLERGFSLSPDLVFFQLFPSNDVSGSLEEQGGFLQTYDPKWKEILRDYRSGQIFRLRLHRSLLINLRTYALLYVWSEGSFTVVDLIDSLIFAAEEMEDIALPPLADRNFALEPSLVNSYPELDRAWSLFEEVIVATSEDCRKRKVDFAGFAIPSKAVVKVGIWKHFVHQSRGKVVYDRWKSTRKTREIFERNGLTYISTAEKFRKFQQSNDLYWEHDGHLKPSGAQFVAETLRDYLVNEYFGKAD